MTKAIEGKELAFSPRTWDLKEFEELGKKAKDAGFTHLFISHLAKASDFQGEEIDSPWCAWSQLLPAIFELVTPKGLEGAFPAERVKEQFAYVQKKHDICEKLGMKAAYYGLEPHWLHENVYRKHPTWRGTRCDNSLRATGMYFSPNTDHPEVREAYAEAIQMLSKAFPLLDMYWFTTNDSGAFYPWAKRMFNGVIGPTSCQGKDMGLRVQEFLMTLRDAAVDAGADARFFTNVYGWFNDDETKLVLRSLKPGIGVAGVCPGEYEEECSVLTCGGSPYYVWPIINGQGTIMGAVNGALNAKTAKAKRYVGGGNDDDYFRAFKFALANLERPTNTRERLDIRYKTAVEFYGEAAADDVVDAWDLQDKANAASGAYGQAHTELRWFVRPLVAHQNLLSEEERSYWEPYLYNSKAGQPDTYLDYLNISGYNFVSNWDDASVRACAVDVSEGLLKQAAEKFRGAKEKVNDEATRTRLEMDACRVLVERSMHLSARSFMQVQTLVYIRDAENEDCLRGQTANSAYPDMPRGSVGDNACWYMQRAIMWEIENVAELIEVIRAAPGPLIFTAPNETFENSLILGGDILGQLEKKLEITTAHFRDSEIGYYKPTLGG